MNMLGFYICSFFLGAYTVSAQSSEKWIMLMGLGWFSFWIAAEFLSKGGGDSNGKK